MQLNSVLSVDFTPQVCDAGFLMLVSKSNQVQVNLNYIIRVIFSQTLEISLQNH